MENGVRRDHFSQCPEGEGGMVRGETEVCRSWTVLANSPKPFSCMVVKIKTCILDASKKGLQVKCVNQDQSYT